MYLSSFCYLNTARAILSGENSQIRIANVTLHSVEIEWRTAVDVAKVAETKVGFSLHIKEQSDDFSTPVSNTHYSGDVEWYCYLYRDLTPGTSYTFSVQSHRITNENKIITTISDEISIEATTRTSKSHYVLCVRALTRNKGL